MTTRLGQFARRSAERARRRGAGAWWLLLGFALTFAAAAPGGAQSARLARPTEAKTAAERVGPAALDPYVTFLRESAGDPVDYVLGLFEDHDLVILSERWHPEVTQYSFIWSLVADPRFAQRVGAVFTEIGARNLQPDLDALMAAPGLDRAQVEHRLVPLFRNLCVHPFWDSTNYFRFLTDLYALNRSRPAGRRIRVRFTDLPIDWKDMTAESYQRFWKTDVAQRDRKLADAVLAGFHDLEKQGGRPAKALVIMNYRHAFNDFQFADGSRGDDVGRYLFEALPGRVANVMLNSLALLPGTTDREPVTEPIQKGKWDAAFRRAGVEEAGFDFRGSPFGADHFDYFDFRPHTARYEDVFDGFVFYRPITEHRLESGIPGMFEDGFAEEARRRMEVVGHGGSEADLQEIIAASEHPELETYPDLERLESMIDRWLEEPSGPGS